MNPWKAALAFVLGVSAFLVGTLSDGLLGAARSATPPATFVIMGAYLAVCQYFVADRGAGLRANLPTILAMTAPWVLIFVSIVSSETRHSVLSQGIPLLAAGGLGPLAGALVAGASAARKTGE